MLEVSDKDAKFYIALKSLEKALETVVVFPVSINTGLPGERFSRIYYDCTEDPEQGLEIMHKRISNAPESLNSHIKYFDTMLKDLNTIRSALGKNDRKTAGVATLTLYPSVIGYCANVNLGNCQTREDPFFEHPFTIPGHIDSQLLCSLEYNPEHNYEGAVNAAKLLVIHATEFMRRSGKTPYEGIGDQDTGQGTLDGSLRARFELTKDLLAKAGFEQ